MKVLKQNLLMWKKTKNFVSAVLWEKQIGRVSTKHSWRKINADVSDPMTETSVGGVRYYVCFQADYLKYRRVFFITT